MLRDPGRLAEATFDILVIGAGIYGATLAWDAAQRGLSVAIIDRGDFGAATSFNSLKTIHGGLRSLQRAAFRDMREFIRERRALSQIAPHLVHPLPFLVPTYRHPLRNRPLMRAVLAVNDLVAADRNAMPDASKHLPASHVLSRDECLALNPAIDPTGVTGGALWYDCQMYSADRVTLSFLLSASRAGATAANYVDATAITVAGNRITGVRARDAVADEAFDIRARLVVNAAGPWVWSLLGTLGGQRSPARAHGFSKAINLVTRAVATTHGLGGLVDGRFLFIAPWRDVSVIGTGHDPRPGGDPNPAVTRRDVDAFLAEVRRAFPQAGLTTADVRLVHRGLLPAAAGSAGHERLLKQSLVIDHRRDGLEGLMTVLGVRYTTARATAAHGVDLALTMLGRTPVPCRTDSTPLDGGHIESFPDFERDAIRTSADLAPDTVRRLVRCYGTTHPSLVRLMREQPVLAQPLSPACPVTRAEILHAVRHEMAVHLADAVIRRTDAGSAGHPGADAVRAAAAILAAELGWTDARTREEIDEVDRFYRIPD